MINKPNNWDKVQAAQERVKLPAGGYVVKIMGAKVAQYSNNEGQTFEKLEMALDIIEGEYKEFYEKDFKMQNTEDKKWKGVLKQYIFKDDGTEKDEWTKSQFKAMTNAIKDSNNGYDWDWDESKLKGKIVGCLFRLEEWSVNGKKGWKAQPFKFIPVDDVRNENFKVPKFKPHRDYPNDTPDDEVKTQGQSAQFEPIEEDDGDLPF